LRGEPPGSTLDDQWRLAVGKLIEVLAPDERSFNPVGIKLAIGISTNQITTFIAASVEEVIQNQIREIAPFNEHNKCATATLADDTLRPATRGSLLNFDQQEAADVNPNRDAPLAVRIPKGKDFPA
jgi:hypothetical protein